MNKIWYILLGVVLMSCNQENKCIKTRIDNTFLKEYVVEIDTCNTFEGSSHVKYFYKDSLFMSGFGDRNNRQGYWGFFKNNEIITKGVFNDFGPKGVWKYKNIGEIDWSYYINEEEGYSFSVSDKWEGQHVAGGIAFHNSKNIIISVLVSYDDRSIDSILNDVDYKKKNGVYNVKIKKTINFKKNIDEFYEYTCNSIYQEMGDVRNSCFIYKVNNKIYLMNIFLKTGSEYDYTIIVDQILHSFRINGLD
ncbi:MAG: hypothetical protein HRT66_13560 [Flavobacteriaceae bacterium]|nr:hypothetical protein [Flavobacteriaceae bacterium]